MNGPLLIILSTIALTACADPAPPATPATAPPLEVPPLPPQKAAPEKISAHEAPPATGDDDESPLPRDPAAAEQEFQEGHRAMASGDVPKAYQHYLRSLRLDHATGTLLNLAICEQRLGNRDAAIRHLEQAYAESVRDGRTDRAKMAKYMLDDIRSKP